MSQSVAVGQSVTCEYRGAHVGIVLAVDDPRVWSGSVAFPEMALPEAIAVVAHVAWCRRQGLLRDSVPVLWGFGSILWDRRDSLHPA